MTVKTKAVVIALCAAVAGLAVYQGYQALKPAPAPAPKEVLVEAALPTSGSIAVTSDFIGRVAPDQMVEVYPKAQGTVLHTYVQPGDTVKAGDLLMEIDPTDIQLQVDIAAAGYDLAAASAAQTTGSALELQRIQAENSYDAAARGYRQAKEALDEFEDGYGDNLDTLETVVQQTKAAMEGANAQLAAHQAQLEELKKQLEDLENGQGSAVTDDQLTAAQELVAKAEAAVTAVDPSDAEGRAKAEADLSIAQQNLARLESGADQPQDPPLSKDELEKKIAEMETLIKADEIYCQSAQNAYQQAQTALAQAEAGYDVSYDQLKDAVRQASSARDTAEESLDVLEEMVVPEVDAIAKAQLAQAEASLRAAAQQLSYTKVYAPIDGVVEASNVKENNSLSAQMPAFVVSNKGMLTVSFNVPADIASALEPGDPVTVENGAAAYDGTILEVSTKISDQSGLFPVKAQILSNDPTLLTGLAVKVTVDAKRADNALLIPADAVYYQQEESFVYLLKEGKAVRTPVTTGLSSGGQVQILEGISADDAVITTWSSGLEDGAQVTLSGALPSQQKAAQEAPAAPESEASSSQASPEEAAGDADPAASGNE